MSSSSFVAIYKRPNKKTKTKRGKKVYIGKAEEEEEIIKRPTNQVCLFILYIYILFFPSAAAAVLYRSRLANTNEIYAHKTFLLVSPKGFN